MADKIHLVVEKDGERRDVNITCTTQGGLKVVKRISALNKEKWKLVEVTGDNKRWVAIIRNSMVGIMPSVKEVIAAGVSPVCPDGKLHIKLNPIDIAKAKLQARKEKKEMEKASNSSVE